MASRTFFTGKRTSAKTPFAFPTSTSASGFPSTTTSTFPTFGTQPSTFGVPASTASTFSTFGTQPPTSTTSTFPSFGTQPSTFGVPASTASTFPSFGTTSTTSGFTFGKQPPTTFEQVRLPGGPEYKYVSSTLSKAGFIPPEALFAAKNLPEQEALYRSHWPREWSLYGPSETAPHGLEWYRKRVRELVEGPGEVTAEAKSREFFTPEEQTQAREFFEYMKSKAPPSQYDESWIDYTPSFRVKPRRYSFY